MYFWGDLPKAVTKIQIIFKNGEVYELPRSAIYGVVAHCKLKNSDVFEYIDIEINAEYKNFKPITEIDNKGLFERIESCWDINCIDVFFNGGLDQKIFCSWQSLLDVNVNIKFKSTFFVFPISAFSFGNPFDSLF